MQLWSIQIIMYPFLTSDLNRVKKRSVIYGIWGFTWRYEKELLLIIKIHKRAFITFGYPFSKRLRYKELILTEMSRKVTVGCWWSFREQQKLGSSYLSYLIYHEVAFIVNTAGGGGGGGVGEKILKLRFPILSKRKTNKNYLHPRLPPLHTKVESAFIRHLLPFVSGGCHHW